MATDLVPDLNKTLQNLVYTFKGLKTNALREADAQVERAERYREYGASAAHVASMPDGSGPQRAAAFYQHCADEAAAGRIYIGLPPDEAPPLNAIPGFYEAQAAAILANRVTYERDNDPWKFTDNNIARPDAAPAKPVEPARDWRPSAGAQQKPQPTPPLAPRGTGEFAKPQFGKKDAKVLKRLAKETRRGY